MADDIDRDVNVASRANAESAWTFGTMFLHFNDRLTDLEERSTEARHELDHRLEQRAHAQEIALGAALASLDKTLAAMSFTAKNAMEEADRRYEQRWAAQQEAVKAALFMQERTLDHAIVSSTNRHIEGEKRVSDRWDSLEKATATAKHAADEILADRDKRFEQRYIAQEIAVTAALMAQEKAVTTAMVSAKEAVLKAEASNERRFESVNEFRGTLSDQATRLIPRIEVDSRLQAISEKMSDMSARMDRSEGKGSGMSMLWGIIVAGFGALGVLVTIGMLLARSHS